MATEKNLISRPASGEFQKEEERTEVEENSMERTKEKWLKQRSNINQNLNGNFKVILNFKVAAISMFIYCFATWHLEGVSSKEPFFYTTFSEKLHFSVFSCWNQEFDSFVEFFETAVLLFYFTVWRHIVVIRSLTPWSVYPKASCLRTTSSTKENWLTNSSKVSTIHVLRFLLWRLHISLRQRCRS